MCTKFSNSVETILKNWTPPKRFTAYNVQDQLSKFKNKKSGISI
jgi:hypothetical protein